MLADGLDLACHRARHEHARLALQQVVALCNDVGVKVLPVKGVLTGRLFYSDPGERPIQDVDLRVRRADLVRVESAGTHGRWKLLGRSRAYGTLSFDVLGFLVEFESSVGPPGLCDLRVEDMLVRAESRVEPLGFAHLQPELHDHALHLCANVFKDKLIEAVPGAISDLEIVSTRPAFDPDRFARLARETGSATMVWIVARWLEETRGSAAWGDVCQRIGPESPRPRYARLFERALRTPHTRRTWLRVLARAGADRPTRVVRALSTMACQGFESAWGAPSNALGRRRIRNMAPTAPVGGATASGPR
jgi:hypothetical protein